MAPHALTGTISLSRCRGDSTTWDLSLLLPVPEECLGHESWCLADEDSDLGHDETGEQEKELAEAMQPHRAEEHTVASPIFIAPSDDSLSTAWPALRPNGIGAEWELCSEASKTVSSWTFLEEEAERISFAEAVRQGAGMPPPKVAPIRPSTLRMHAKATPEEEKENDEAICEDAPFEKDGRGGRWTRLQKGTRSTKQLSRVESKICKRMDQRMGMAGSPMR